MALSSSPKWGQMLSLLIGITVAALLMRQVIAQDATPTATDAASRVIDDGSCEPNDECRAHHGSIFFGRVVDVVEAGKFPGELNLAYVVYAVDVESVLRHFSSEGSEGRVQEDRVRIEVDGIDLPINDKGRAAPLVVGERYLFFAGLKMDKGYLVDEEVGFLPVANDEEAEKLSERFLPLIRQDDRDVAVAIALATEAARFEPTTPPLAEITPRSGPAGSEVVITGSGFAPAHILFLWDEANPEQLPEATSGPDGRFKITLTVPKELSPGQHTLSVEGLGSDEAAVTFTVEK
jgi:hypothetical protein